jgi:hypothetical protein
MVLLEEQGHLPPGRTARFVSPARSLGESSLDVVLLFSGEVFAMTSNFSASSGSTLQLVVTCPTSKTASKFLQSPCRVLARGDPGRCFDLRMFRYSAPSWWRGRRPWDAPPEGFIVPGTPFAQQLRCRGAAPGAATGSRVFGCNILRPGGLANTALVSHERLSIRCANPHTTEPDSHSGKGVGTQRAEGQRSKEQGSIRSCPCVSPRHHTAYTLNSFSTYPLSVVFRCVSQRRT